VAAGGREPPKVEKEYQGAAAMPPFFLARLVTLPWFDVHQDAVDDLMNGARDDQ
jgi:hypothetical protein